MKAERDGKKMQTNPGRIIFRACTKEDEPALRQLLVSSIGEREHMFEGLEEGSYLVADLDGRIIAASGICYNEEYQGYELDYTATLEGYRENGIMKELFSKLLSSYKGRLICCSWRLHENVVCNLYGLLKRYGFKEVLHPVSAYRRGYNCFYDDQRECPYIRVHEKCVCFEDLWVKEF